MDMTLIHQLGQALPHDPQFQQALRDVHEPDVAEWLLPAYAFTIMASRRAGSPVALGQAVPILWPELGAALRALARVGLLDADGRLPRAAWTRWGVAL